jgi:hypothetical protein
MLSVHSQSLLSKIAALLLVAVCPAALAQVVYTDPTDTRLGTTGTFIDLNLDGLTDIQLFADVACTDDFLLCYNSVNVLSLDPVNINILVDLTPPFLHSDGAAAFNDGDQIIADFNYSPAAYLASNLSLGAPAQAGTMIAPGTRSIAVILWEADGPHLAYVRIRNTNGLISGFDLVDYAYQGAPYAPIIAGDTGTPATPCPADFNDDGGVDGADVESFYITFATGEPAADVNIDGGVDGADIETFFMAWMAGGCG